MQKIKLDILLIARSDNNYVHIFMLYHKRSNNNYIFDVSRSKDNQPSWDARENCKGNNDMAHATIKFLICCWLQGWRQWSFFQLRAKSYNNDGWLQQKNTRLRQAKTNQIFMTHCRSKWQSWNDNIVNTMINFLHPVSYCKKLLQGQ